MPFVQPVTQVEYSPQDALNELTKLSEFSRQARSIVQQFGPLFHRVLLAAGCTSTLHTSPESYSNSVKFYANITLDVNGSFTDVTPILSPFLESAEHSPGGLVWKTESRDSDFSPMRIYTISNDTFARVTILFQLYVHLPDGGTKDCQVKKIVLPPNEAKPTVKYEIVCGGSSN